MHFHPFSPVLLWRDINLIRRGHSVSTKMDTFSYEMSDNQQKLARVIWDEFMRLQESLRATILASIREEGRVPEGREMDVVMSIISHMALAPIVDFIYMEMADEHKDADIIEGIMTRHIKRLVGDIKRHFGENKSTTLQ
jgi:hypothetical protein